MARGAGLLAGQEAASICYRGLAVEVLVALALFIFVFELFVFAVLFAVGRVRVAGLVAVDDGVDVGDLVGVAVAFTRVWVCAVGLASVVGVSELCVGGVEAVVGHGAASLSGLGLEQVGRAAAGGVGVYVLAVLLEGFDHFVVGGERVLIVCQEGLGAGEFLGYGRGVAAGDGRGWVAAIVEDMGGVGLGLRRRVLAWPGLVFV